MLAQKLRLYAMIMRLTELQEERRKELNNRLRFQFDNPPITLIRMPTPEPLSYLDKNGKPFDLPKSKYHK